jgi:hypothetical protein
VIMKIKIGSSDDSGQPVLLRTHCPAAQHNHFGRRECLNDGLVVLKTNPHLKQYNLQPSKHTRLLHRVNLAGCLLLR